MSAPLIEVRNLTKAYPAPGGSLVRLLRGGGPQTIAALSNVSFDIYAGEILSVVGESGSGKTTLGRCLLRLVEPTSGEVRFEGTNVLASSRQNMRVLRSKMQMIFQDPYSSLNPSMTVRQMLAEVLHVHNLAHGSAASERIAELLSLVGLPVDSADRYPADFSGGQRQRLGIARALAVGPSFIVGDEPVSAVDVSVQAQILNLLLDLRDRLGLTVLLIAHDLSVVQYISTRVAVMYLGRLVEIAPRAQLFATPRHPYSQALLRAAPRPDPTLRKRGAAILGEPPSPIDPPPGCAFHTRCPLADAQCRVELPALVDIGGRQVACHHHARALEAFRAVVD